MTKKEFELLTNIQQKCYEKPEFLTHIINAGVSGITEQERQMREQAADMEAMASDVCFFGG